MILLLLKKVIKMGRFLTYIAVVLIILYGINLAMNITSKINEDNSKVNIIKCDGKVSGRCDTYFIDSNHCIHYYDIDTHKEKISCGTFEIE